MDEHYKSIRGQSEITSVLGYWPEFADGKVRELCLQKPLGGPATLRCRLAYTDLEVQVAIEVELVFSDVSRMELGPMRTENVLDELVIKSSDDTGGGSYAVELISCVGVAGVFTCSEIEVKLMSTKTL